MNNEPLHEEGYATALLGDEAVRTIEAHDGENPLFMYLAFTAPHTPYQAPRAYLDRYPDVADPNRQAYDAMVTAMDEQIGRVLSALDEKGMRDNTLLIFHSDNGGVRTAAFAGEIETSGDLPADNGPFRGGKGTLYEGGTRAVALANWPGHIAPGKVEGMMHVVDMFPTLAGLAGADTTTGKPLDGIDMWPTISTGAPSPRHEVVYNVEMFRGAVREDDWKLVWSTPLPARKELYDLAADPSETTDLAAEHPQIVDRLEARIGTLAGEMEKSKFFAATMDAYMGRHAGPPAFPAPAAPLPNEADFYASFD